MRFPQFQYRNVTQASLGKFDRLLRAPAGSTALAFDGCGLRDQSPARPARDASYPVSVRQVAVLLRTSFRHRLAVMPLRFAKPSPPSGWLEDFHPQAIEHARHATNPLRGSGAASAAMASRGKARHSGRAWCQHARNRIVRQSLSATLVDRLSQPRVAADTQRCLQRFDSAADLKQTKPILARSTPYPHGLYPPHRVFHRSAGRHWPTFTTIAPWINSTAPASASRGDRLG